MPTQIASLLGYLPGDMEVLPAKNQSLYVLFSFAKVDRGPGITGLAFFRVSICAFQGTKFVLVIVTLSIHLRQSSQELPDYRALFLFVSTTHCVAIHTRLF